MQNKVAPAPYFKEALSSEDSSNTPQCSGYFKTRRADCESICNDGKEQQATVTLALPRLKKYGRLSEQFRCW